MKRDFSNESYLNIIIRILRALKLRIRGNIYSFMFAENTSSHITFGISPKFMNTRNILFEKNVGFGNMCRIETYKMRQLEGNNIKIFIGENSSFGDFVHIGAINYISIGKNVLGGSKILIIDHNHGETKNLEKYTYIPPRERELVSKSPIRIGNNVWLGDGVVILAGSVIGDGAIIAANTVVKGKVDANTVYFGR